MKHRHSKSRFLDDGKTRLVLSEIWRALDGICREHGSRLPPVEIVPDNVDCLERAAHLELAKDLVIICRSRLVDGNDIAKGMVAELVISEFAPNGVLAIKIAVAHYSCSDSWMFSCNGVLHELSPIKELLKALGITKVAQFNHDVAKEVALALIEKMNQWAAKHAAEKRG